MDEDSPGFEYADGLRAAAVDERRDLGIRVYVHKAAAELVAVADSDRPCVIFGVLVTLCEQLLEHDCDLLAVRSGERIELEWMLADRQVLVVGRAGDRAIDTGELAAAG